MRIAVFLQRDTWVRGRTVHWAGHAVVGVDFIFWSEIYDQNIFVKMDIQYVRTSLRYWTVNNFSSLKVIFGGTSG
jgi:hypothetical protein